MYDKGYAESIDRYARRQHTISDKGHTSRRYPIAVVGKYSAKRVGLVDKQSVRKYANAQDL